MTKRRRHVSASDDREAEIQAGIAQDPDNPELNDADLGRMRPAKDVLPPALYEALTRRSMSQSPTKRVQVTLRLDPDALAAFKATGRGWRGRMNDAIVARAAEMLAEKN